MDGAGIPVDAVRDHPKLLRLFAALNPSQRARLDTTGVRLRELSPSQTGLLLVWKPAAMASADSRLRLRREVDTAVFSLEAAAGAPQEERVPFERGRPAGGG